MTPALRASPGRPEALLAIGKRPRPKLAGLNGLPG